MGLRRVVIEGDALSVIRRVKALKEDRSVLRSYIQDIQILSKGFEECRFQKISRFGNGVANELVRGAVESRNTNLGHRLPR